MKVHYEWKISVQFINYSVCLMKMLLLSKNDSMECRSVKKNAFFIDESHVLSNIVGLVGIGLQAPL